MAKAKYDAVVQAVHYGNGGKIAWARTFQRRGPIWSDYVLVNRQDLIDQIKSGKRYMTGRRVQQMGGTFEVERQLRVIQRDGDELLGTNGEQSNRDYLENVPVI
jgi:hypothetical protein